MYIDYLKNDYSGKTEQEKEQYIKRDKRHLGGVIQERITNNIDNIVDRWYELDDIGYIPENEKFLYLLKEVEQLYCFAYYTGTISIVSIASEEWHLLNIRDVYREVIDMSELEQLFQVVSLKKDDWEDSNGETFINWQWN